MPLLWDSEKKGENGAEKEEQPGKKERKAKTKVVTARIPEEMYERIEKYIIGKEYLSFGDYIRDLIRKDLKERKMLDEYGRF